jgi:hypothetical protein
MCMQTSVTIYILHKVICNITELLNKKQPITALSYFNTRLTLSVNLLTIIHYVIILKTFPLNAIYLEFTNFLYQ